jgi:hypothetical protein
VDYLLDLLVSPQNRLSIKTQCVSWAFNNLLCYVIVMNSDVTFYGFKVNKRVEIFLDNQPHRVQLTDQPTYQPTNQPTNQPMNQPTNYLTNWPATQLTPRSQALLDKLPVVQLLKNFPIFYLIIESDDSYYVHKSPPKN